MRGGACEVSGAVGTGTSGVHSGRGRECRGAKSVRAQEPNLLFTDKQAPRVPALPSAPQCIPIGAHLKPQASDPAGGDDPPGPARDRYQRQCAPRPSVKNPNGLELVRNHSLMDTLSSAPSLLRTRQSPARRRGSAGSGGPLSRLGGSSLQHLRRAGALGRS